MIVFYFVPVNPAAGRLEPPLRAPSDTRNNAQPAEAGSWTRRTPRLHFLQREGVRDIG